MTRKPSQARNVHAYGGQHHAKVNANATSALPSLHDADDSTLSFGPRSLDPDRRSERISYRDPEEPTQGPLRLDETNYSVERLTLPEGGYNEYADEVTEYRDEEGMPHMHYGPRSGDEWQDPQYRASAQGDWLDDLPRGVSVRGFRLTSEDVENSPDHSIDRGVEKNPGFGRHVQRGSHTK